MTKTRKNKKMSTKKKLAIGLGSAAALGGLGFGAYKLGPKAVSGIKSYRAKKEAARAAEKAALREYAARLGREAGDKVNLLESVLKSKKK